MKCPVCGSASLEKKAVCQECGWTYVEDAALYSVLFGDLQLKWYGEQIVALRAEFKEEFREESIEEADEPEIEIRVREPETEGGEPEREQEFGNADFYINHKSRVNLDARLWMYLDALAYSYEMGETELTGEDALIYAICDEIAKAEWNNNWINTCLGNLHVGDYFYLTLSNREKVKFVVAGFGQDLSKLRPEFAGKMKGYINADGEPIERYAFIVPENSFAKIEPMQKIGLLERPDQLIDRYEDSYIYNEVLPKYTKMLKKKFGSHLVHQEGKPELELLSYEFLYGNKEMKYAGLPLFTTFPDMRETTIGMNGKEKKPYWLKDEGRKGFLSNEGEDVLPYKKLGVRPIFRIG